ncbi:MAG TPA: hypothetical protein VIH93_01850 [Thermoanaerobaculia bacterium]
MVPSRGIVVLAATGLFACGGAAPPPSAPTVPITASASAPSLSHPGPKELPGTSIHFAGGDGSSLEKAILIHGAHGETDGAASEYQYIALLYGPQGQHWRTKQQSLLNDKGRQFDELEIDHDGKAESFFFDITEYFGKF